MQSAVPVLFAVHLIKLAVTRQVIALNPALRIPPNVTCKLARQNTTLKIEWIKEFL
jgi:hypothetical protein